MNINGYDLSEWTFSTGGEVAVARKGGRSYFLKRYNAALMPSEGASPETRAKQEEKFSRMKGRRDRINATLDEIDDPTIVKTVESFIDECHLIEVNSFVENVTEAAEVAALPAKQKLKALLSAVHAVALIHAKGLVHSDIKPPNLLMVRSGDNVEARLIDFDSSYFTDETATLKGVGGDDFYGAPETVANMGDSDPELRSYLSEKADIFSLGLTLYEYYTGEKFYTGKKETRVWSLLCDGEEVTVGEEVKEPLRKTIQKMISYEPADRPTARQVYDVIAAMATESGGEREPSDTVSPVRRRTPERREPPAREPSVRRTSVHGGAGTTASPDDGYPLNEPWREDNIEFVKEYFDYYEFVNIERILDAKGERYYRLTKRNGVNLMRKKEQLMIMGCAREKTALAAEESADVRGSVEEAAVSDATDGIELVEETGAELPAEGTVTGECAVCDPWPGHRIIFAGETLAGLGCKKVERADRGAKTYRFVFERTCETDTLAECIEKGYAVEKEPTSVSRTVTEREVGILWEGDEGTFDADVMSGKRVRSIARCMYRGHKEYEVIFVTPAGTERRCILDYASLKVLGLIA